MNYFYTDIILVIILLFQPAYANENKTTLSIPTVISYKDESVIITDNPSQINQGNKVSYLILKNSNTQYIPILVAIIAMISSLYIAWINYKLTRKQKWHDQWLTRTSKINDSLYNLSSKFFDANSESDKFLLEIELRKVKSQLKELINPSDEINQLFDNLQTFIAKDFSYKERAKLFEIVENITKTISEEMKR